MQNVDLQFVDLLLIDDILPSDFSPFRTTEYGHYLDFFNSALLSLEGWYPSISNASFVEQLARLPIEESLKRRIVPFRIGQDLVARLAYVSFLGNAARLLPYFETRKMPFILQLYPGNNFEVNQPETDEKLRRVLSSPLCRKVITTQTLTRDYIVDRIGCDPMKVEFIYGGVFESRIDFDFHRDKILFGRDKDLIDLCFVAHRYGDDPAAKGYDHFVTVARSLAANDARVRFHVVGNYRPDDLDLGDAADRFTFYGARPSSFFATFYPRMDAIISVNKPFVLSPGAFDGFPTGACIEAGFRGVLNCIADPLGLNIALTDDSNCALLDFDTEHTLARLRALLAAPQQLYELAYNNWRRFHELFNVERQLSARTRLITNELSHPEALIVRPSAHRAGLDGTTELIIAPWRQQLQSHIDALKDTNQRHQGLIDIYKDLEKRHERLFYEYQDLEKRHAQLMQWHNDLATRNAALESSVCVAPQRPSARILYQALRTKITRRQP